jgi:hypothetical protein
MHRRLEGRRVAVVGSATGAAMVVEALTRAGAQPQRLEKGEPEAQWHGGMYAGLVLLGDEQAVGDARLTQLVREFLVADKPVAALGMALRTILESGGVAGRQVAADDALRGAVEEAGATCVSAPIEVEEALITARSNVDVKEFAERVVMEFSERLEDRDVDEMSELSFPASDPPAISPASIGKGKDPRPEDRA